MRGLLTLFSVLGFLALIGSGLYYGYGMALQYGHETIAELEATLEEEINDELLVLNAEVTFSKIYVAQDFSHFGFEVQVELDIQPDEVRYGKLQIADMSFEEVDSLDVALYTDVSFVLTQDPLTVQGEAITYAIVSLAVWIGFWILKVFFPKRKK